VHDNPLFCFWEDAICALSFFVRFSEKPGFCGYFLGVRTLFKGRRTKTASIGSVATLPANGFPFVLANRFKGSGFNLLNYKVVPLLEYYYS